MWCEGAQWQITRRWYFAVEGGPFVLSCAALHKPWQQKRISTRTRQFNMTWQVWSLSCVCVWHVKCTVSRRWFAVEVCDSFTRSKLYAAIFESFIVRLPTLDTCKWCPQACPDSRRRFLRGNGTVAVAMRFAMKMAKFASRCGNSLQFRLLFKNRVHSVKQSDMLRTSLYHCLFHPPSQTQNSLLGISVWTQVSTWNLH